MVHTFHYPRGGDSTYTRTLTGLLEGAGHAVAPLAMRHPENEPSTWEARFPPWIDLRRAETPLERLRVARELLWSSTAARATRELIADFRPDVAHLQHVHRHLTPSVLDPLNAAGIPVVWTVHDYELICPEGHLFTQGAPCERCRDGRYLQHALQHRCKWGAPLPSAIAALEKHLHRWRRVWERVDRFLCPSAFLARKLVEFGVPAERVQVQPNPLLPGAPPADTPGEGWLYAGRLTEEKGVEVVLAAARLLPGRRLRICGDGPLLPVLRDAAAELPWVELLGHLPPARMQAELQQARVVVVPSRWYENFPYAVLEAQAAGRAVVASAIGGIPEQITDGQDGRLVPPNDPAALANAVAALLDNPEQAAALGRAGAARVRQNLRPDDHLRAILGTYQAVTRRPA